MDSDSLYQIKSVSKEAMDDAIDRKVGDVVEYKMNALFYKFENKINPLAEKLNSVFDLCTKLQNSISELKQENVSRLKSLLEELKKMINLSDLERAKNFKLLTEQKPKKGPSENLSE